nr:hypothetical protein [uncultured Cellulosilyticum sp.]
MSILWLIIKIILVVLLALLILLILGLLIILICPISYEVYLEKYDELIYDIKFTYLGLIRGRFCLEKDYKKHEIKAFGKLLYEGEIEEAEKEQASTRKHPKAHETNKGPKDEISKKALQPMKKQAQKSMQEKTKVKQTRPSHDVNEEEIDTPVMEDIQETSEEAVHKVTNETKSFAKNLDRHQIKELLFEKNFWRLIKEVWYVVKSIIKYILPREWSYEVIIGGQDPAQTGELIAKLTMLYPLYYKHGIVKGDFERNGIWGGFLAKGKFNLFGILKRIVIFLCRPVVREYIRLILRIRKEEKDGK